LIHKFPGGLSLTETGALSGGSDTCAMPGFSQVLPAVEKGARMKLIGTAGQLTVQTIYTRRPNIKP
jgi:hypothetical protein